MLCVVEGLREIPGGVRRWVAEEAEAELFRSTPPPLPPREYNFFSRQKTREQMYWRAATDPTEKMFLHSMLESMWVDLDAARAQMGGSDVGSDTPGGGGGEGEDGGNGDE